MTITTQTPLPREALEAAAPKPKPLVEPKK